jgi:GNAT superfamily N-acetyltransferase/phosphoglycolate phosphatase-like HAD superfamily hydrolase
MHATIFDIDGTLLQSAAVDDALYREAVVAVLGPVQLRPSLHAYDYVTDTGILSQIFADNDILPSPDAMQEIKSHFVELLRKHIASHGPFVEIPGATRLLRDLSASTSHAVAIATGGWRESAELKLQSAGIDYSNIPLATADDHYERTGIMLVALAQLRADLNSVTYYGDGPWDRDACAALGWRFVSVGPELNGIDSYVGHRPVSHTIRPMSVDDIDAIFRVRTAVVHNHMSEDELRKVGITREWVAKQLRTGDLDGWVATCGGRVEGFSLATDATREVNALFVLPEKSGYGMGMELLDAAVEHLRNQAPGPVRLRTDPKTPAYAFYLRRGWRDTGENHEADGSDRGRYLELE